MILESYIGENVAIEKIKEVENPRKSLGDITELTASIKEIGIVEPLIVDGDYNLIAGHRRLAAAKAAGLSSVPTRILSEENHFETAMAENIHRKDLTPIEEADAYQDFLNKNKSVTMEALARKLGKAPVYVERRLVLLKLIPEAQKALEGGKILLGHAVIISRMGPKLQKEKLQKVLSEKLSVGRLAEMMKNKWMSATYLLDEAKFDKKECEGCIHNGGQQAILDETGSNLKGVCLAPDCYLSKTNGWVGEQTKALQKKGINIVNPEKALSRHAEEVETYDDDYKRIVNMRLVKEPDVFAVGFKVEHGVAEKQLYCLKPELREKPGRGTGEVDEKQEEKVLNLDRRERLNNRVNYYYRDLAVDTSKALAKSDEKVWTREMKALVLYEIMEKTCNDIEFRSLLKEESCEKVFHMRGGWCPEVDLSRVLDLPEKTIDLLLRRVPTLFLDDIHTEELTRISGSLGFSLQKHFSLTEDYLNMYTIDQLQALVKELGLKVKAEKKVDIVNAILKADTKGKIPKILLKKQEV